jgi:hypothetical protein
MLDNVDFFKWKISHSLILSYRMCACSIMCKAVSTSIQKTKLITREIVFDMSVPD